MSAADRHGGSEPRSAARVSVFAGLAILFTVLMFARLFGPGAILFSTDDNVANLACTRSALPQGFLGRWEDMILLGMPSGRTPPSWTDTLIWLLGPRLFANWGHAIELILGSVFLALYLREKGLGLHAWLVAALTAFWLGSNFTLIHAGHIRKFATMMFAAAFLWTVLRAARAERGTDRILWGLAAGGALGFMLMEQLDVAVFLCLFLGPYVLFEIFRAGWRRAQWIRLAWLSPVPVLALLMALPTLLSYYQQATAGVVSVDQEDPRAKWEFVTQWSWPPEESIDFVAPGFMGWRSGEPEGPYWGRMGRSAGWEGTRQGFMNFKLENQYIGAIPIGLALLALLGAWLGRAKGPPDAGPDFLPAPHRPEIVFWSAALVVSLLLAFGKYTPLYRLIFHVPVLNNVRNPNKFLHVFQLALGILAAYGLDACLRRRAVRPAEHSV